MSIFPAVTELFELEHKYRPITGDVLLIGRQRVEYSTQTDKEYFERFPISSLKALDVSDYEGAEIIFDLNIPLPVLLHGKADFIFDGSCLDNIFDAATALKNLSRLLRPGGRIVLMEHGTAIQGALQVFSPEWFFGYFAINNYIDCRIKLFTFPCGITGEPWVAHRWRPFMCGVPVTATPGTEIGDFMNVVVAEKGPDSTDNKTPIQAQYRDLHGDQNELFHEAWRRYIKSGRVW